ncbi:hypothetical protein PIB30_036492, partial [Stylosanthes scabra]|nr:hypothetical protein [Stylosanthes scabra]
MCGVPAEKKMYDDVWSGKILPRFKLLIWFVINDGLSTKDKLIRRNIIQQREGNCILCGSE